MITVECLKTEEELEEALRLCYRLLAPELMVTLPGGKDGKKAQEQAIGGVEGAHGGILPSAFMREGGRGACGRGARKTGERGKLGVRHGGLR